MFILSDGEENDSREYDSDQIKELVKECLDLEWKVIYLGSNISEMYGRSAKTYAATTLGIPTEDSETFVCDARGVAMAYATGAVMTANYMKADDDEEIVVTATVNTKK